jgi:hypothetical protein
VTLAAPRPPVHPQGDEFSPRLPPAGGFFFWMAKPYVGCRGRMRECRNAHARDMEGRVPALLPNKSSTLDTTRTITVEDTLKARASTPARHQTGDRCPPNTRERTLPLASNLFAVTLSQTRPHCAQMLKKKGSWFAMIAGNKCAACRRHIAMTYPMRVALFGRMRTWRFPKLREVVS